MCFEIFKRLLNQQRKAADRTCYKNRYIEEVKTYIKNAESVATIIIKKLDRIIGKSITSRLFEDGDIEGKKDEDKGRGDDRRGDEVNGNSDLKTIKK